jgi:hypothetical protein
MNFRMGALGRERIQKQTECFTQIINLSLPALHRYLLWATTESKHAFSCGPPEDHDEFACALPVKMENIKATEGLEAVKADIAGRREGMVSLIGRLLEIKGSIENLVKKV